MRSLDDLEAAELAEAVKATQRHQIVGSAGTWIEFLKVGAFSSYPCMNYNHRRWNRSDKIS